MKLQNAILPIVVVLSGSLFLSACSPNPGPSYPDLSNDKVVAALCGDEAKSTLADVTKAAEAPVNTGKRNALKDWKLDPKDDKATAAIVAALTERAAVACDAESNDGSDDNASDGSSTIEDANAAVTVKSGDLNWAYPDRYTQFIKDSPLGFSTMSIDRIDKDGNVLGTDAVPVFRIASNEPTTGEYPRLYSDAVAPAWCGQSVESIVTCILVYPDYAGMWCAGLYGTTFHTTLGDVSMLENNPWLKDCGSNIVKNNDRAGSAMNAMATNTAKYVQYAKQNALVAEAVERLINTGKGDGTPALNYGLAVVGTNNVIQVNKDAPETTIPEFVTAQPYAGQWLFLNVFIKGQPVGCDPVGANIGYGGIVDKHNNGGDGRFARFVCPPPPPSTTGGGDCTSNCPTTVYTCESIYGSGWTGTYPLGCKAPFVEPAHPQGGGGPNLPQSDPEGAPAGGEPPVTYVYVAPTVQIPAGSTAGGDSGGADQSGGGLQ